MDEPLRIDYFGDLGDLRSTAALKRVLSWSSKVSMLIRSSSIPTER
jgi:hypothetical protein